MTVAEEFRQLLADVEAKARRTAWRAVSLPDGQIVQGESAWQSLLRVWSQKPGLMAMRLLENLDDQLEDRAPALPNMMLHEAVVVRRDQIDDDVDVEEDERGEDPLAGFESADDDLAQIADAIEHSTARELAECRPLEPLPAQVEILRQTVDWATRRGLRLPAHDVVWVEGRRGQICAGAVTVENDRYRLVLDATAFPHELIQTAAHELAHLHDLRAGLTDRIALERRAGLFAAKAAKEIRW